MKKNRYEVFLAQALAPFILVLLTALTHLDFVLMAIAGNTFLNASIIVVGALGSTLMILRIWDMHRERKVLFRFQTETRGGADMKGLLEAPWLSGRVMHRYLDNIAQTGGELSSALDQQAIETELHDLQGEFDSRMEFPGFLVGFMIAMGLLGTFIGLLETLTGISSMLDGMVNSPANDSVEAEFLKLVGQLRKPLAGMGVAFSASMFGLVGSLVLGLIQVTVRRYTKVVMSDARDLLHELTERVRGVAVATQGAAAGQPTSTHGGVSQEFLSDFLAELIGNMNSLMELFNRSQDAALAQTGRIDSLSTRMEEVAGAIDNNVEAAKRTNDLLGFGPRMKETNEAVLTEIRSLLTSGQEQQKALVRAVDTLSSIDQKLANSNDGSRNHYETIGQLNTQSLAKLDEAVGILHDVNDRTSDSETKMDRKLQGLNATANSIAVALQGLSQKLSEVATVSQSQLTNQGSTQVLFRDASSEVQGMLKELQDKIQKLQEVEIGATRHLYGIKESFDNLGGALESLKGLSQGVAKQTSLLEATLEEMRTSQRNFARELRAELRELAREQRQTA
ncbi:MAG TPA: hypothetical protein VM661_19345 [Candidatus Sulfotelmatobacter sp.]|jgi:hypothetical protein|nr:hypothetical protein [Candidatus Sulfotelmatobacter sp.]